MGKKLYQLGALTFRYPFVAIGGWLVLLAVLGFLAMQFIKPTSSSISIPGTEAQQTLDRMNELFPDAGKGTGRIVFAAPKGKIISDYQTAISDATKALDGVAGVVRAVDFTENPGALSEDKRIAFTQLQLDATQGQVDAATIDGVQQVVSEVRKSGLQVESGGDVIDRTPGEILGPGEIAGVMVALVVLIMTLGSLVAAGMPLATAVVAVGVSMAGLFALSEVIEISATTPVLAVMLGLAVGIDYSLFIINRYRKYLLDGFTFEVAAARAIATAGNAVVYAAATVVIALAALVVVQIPFMTMMGLSAAAAIVIAAAVSITLVPALLRLAGVKVFSRRMQKHVVRAQKAGAKEEHHAKRTTFWYRWGKLLTKHPVAIIAVCIVAVTIVALPMRDLQLGLPTDEFAAHSTTERKAYDLLAKGFGVGFNAPLAIVVEGLPEVSEADREAVRAPALERLHAQIEQAAIDQQAVVSQQIAQLQTPEEQAAFQQQMLTMQAQGEQQKNEALQKIEQSVNEFAKLVQLKKVADKIAKDKRVVSAMPAIATSDGTKGLVQVIPDTGPSSKVTEGLIHDLRERKVVNGDDSMRLSVTGTTALQGDINTKLAEALPLYLLVVVGLSFILLIVAFRSILVPLKATLGFLLSVLAMFGALVAIFQWGWFGIAEAPGPIVSFAPIIAVGILFGLAMDYEFFLVSSMREAYHETNDARRSVRRGFAHASKVVLAAAVIMVSVFAGFVFSHDAVIQGLGFALAFGIFVDAFIVRLTLVPAVMTLLGKSAWWMPQWLERLLPHISIEGEDVPEPHFKRSK